MTLQDRCGKYTKSDVTHVEEFVDVMAAEYAYDRALAAAARGEGWSGVDPPGRGGLPELGDPWFKKILKDLEEAAKTVDSIDLKAAKSSGRCSGVSLMTPVIREMIGVDLSGSACFLVDAKSYWIGETGGVGGAVGANSKGVGSLSVSNGRFYSNAENVGELSGYSFCVSATANVIPIYYGALGASGELCLGFRGTPTLGDPVPFSGVWSISYGLSWGTGSSRFASSDRICDVRRDRRGGARDHRGPAVAEAAGDHLARSPRDAAGSCCAGLVVGSSDRRGEPRPDARVARLDTSRRCEHLALTGVDR